jgi:hypothetical protein
MIFDFNKLAADLQQALPEIKSKLDVVLMQNAGAALRKRIHNEGKATDGSSIGSYSPASVLLRSQEGLQTDYVDLEQTGTLRRSQQSGVSNGETVLGIAEINYTDGETTPEVAMYQEQRFGKKIFTLSEDEVTSSLRGALSSINKDLTEAITTAVRNAAKQ